MDKPFSLEFVLNSKILAVMFICYKFKFPASIMLSFYEMYGEKSLYVFKAFSCGRKLKLNDNDFISIMEDSRNLYNHILKGQAIRNKLLQIQKGIIEWDKEIPLPEMPTLNMINYSDEYKEFINNYLLKNIDDLYAHTVKLHLSTDDIYSELA